MANEIPKIQEEEFLRILLPLYFCWKWILIGMVISGFVVLMIGSLFPKYNAQALIMIDHDAIDTDNLNIPSDALVRSLIISDKVLDTLQQDQLLSDPDVKGQNLKALRDKLDFVYSDNSLILSVSDDEPEIAVALANSWAQILNEELQLLISPTESLLEAFQLNEMLSKSGWEQAQEDYLIYQNQSEFNTLKTQLFAFEGLLSRYLLADARLMQAQLDAESLLDQLNKSDSDKSALETKITLFILSSNSLVTNSFNTENSTDDLVQFDLIIDNQLDELSVQNQAEYLEDLIEAMQRRREIILIDIGQINSDIKRVNAAMKATAEEELSLSVNKEIAQDQYKTSRKESIDLNVAKLYAEEAVWISSPAIEAEKSSLSTIVLLGLGSILGGIVAILIIFSRDVWIKLGHIAR
jgi:hypothetical protein